MRLLEKLESQSPLVLDGGLATTLEKDVIHHYGRVKY